VQGAEPPLGGLGRRLPEAGNPVHPVYW